MSDSEKYHKHSKDLNSEISGTYHFYVTTNLEKGSKQFCTGRQLNCLHLRNWSIISLLTLMKLGNSHSNSSSPIFRVYSH